MIWIELINWLPVFKLIDHVSAGSTLSYQLQKLKTNRMFYQYFPSCTNFRISSDGMVVLTLTLADFLLIFQYENILIIEVQIDRIELLNTTYLEGFYNVSEFRISRTSTYSSRHSRIEINFGNIEYHSFAIVLITINITKYHSAFRNFIMPRSWAELCKTHSATQP